MGNFIWADSCGDHYATADLPTVFDTVAQNATIPNFSVGAFGRVGSNGIQSAGSGGNTSAGVGLFKNFTTRSTIVCGLALDLYGGLPPLERPVFEFRVGSTTQVTIALTGAGKITARRGLIGGTLLGTSTASVPTSGYPHLEAKVVISDTVGTVDVRVNGVSVLSLSSQDTKNHATDTNVDNIIFIGEATASQTTVQCRIDDIYIHEDTLQGDQHIGCQVVNGNGDNSDFTGSDGNSTDNYLLVDDSTPSETDYVESNTVGNKDLYQTTNLSFSSGTIPVVAIVTYDRKTDAAATTFRHILKSSATTSNGAAIAPGTANAFHQTLFHTDPNGGGAHSVSSVNAYQIGQEILS